MRDINVANYWPLQRQVKKHIGYSAEIAEICEPLNIFNITSFNFVRTYHDGSQLNLCNIGYWLEHFYHKQYYKEGAFESHPSNYSSGYALWPFLSGQSIFYDARMYFNIDNGVTIIEKHSNYCEFYFFGSTQENTQIVNFYLNHIDLLKRFILYFKSAARKIIIEASQNRLIIPDHFHCINSNNEVNIVAKVSLENFLKATKIKEYHLSGELSDIALTNREVDCILCLMEGKSIPEVANKLFISARTVETHINHVKEKLNCRTRSDLFQKLRCNGFEVFSSNKCNTLVTNIVKKCSLSEQLI